MTHLSECTPFPRLPHRLEEEWWRWLCPMTLQQTPVTLWSPSGFQSTPVKGHAAGGFCLRNENQRLNISITNLKTWHVSSCITFQSRVIGPKEDSDRCNVAVSWVLRVEEARQNNLSPPGVVTRQPSVYNITFPVKYIKNQTSLMIWALCRNQSLTLTPTNLPNAVTQLPPHYPWGTVGFAYLDDLLLKTCLCGS